MDLHKMATAARAKRSGVCVQPKYVENFCGKTGFKPGIPHVYAELCFPIVVNMNAGELGKESWTAPAWNATSDGNNLAYALKLGVEIASDTQLGVPNVLPHKKMQSGLYKNAITKIAKRCFSRATPADEKFLLDNVGKSHYVKWSVYNDLEVAKVELKKSMNKKGSVPDHVVAPTPEVNSLQAEMLKMDGVNTWFQSPVPGVLGLCPTLEEVENHNLFLEQPHPLLPAPRLSNDAMDEEADEAEEGDGEERAPDNISPNEMVADQIDRDDCEKVHTSLSGIPCSDPTKKLFLCRMLVLDPTINVPHYVQQLMLYVHRRESAFTSQANQKKWVERFPHLVRFADTDHPVWNLDISRYLNCCIYFSGQQIDEKEKAALIKNMDLHDPRSLLNPTVAFSIQNALRILQEHGAHAPITNNKHLWKDDNTALWPDEVITFVYPPEQVFWAHDLRIGLAEMMIPEVTNTIDVYSALLRGDDIDPYLDALENGVDRLLPSEVPANQLGISTARVLRRSDLENARRVAYETGNQMVHQAAEAQVIYTRVQRFYPIDATDIYEEVQPYVQEFKKYWISQLSAADQRAFQVAITKARGNQNDWPDHIADAAVKRRIMSVHERHHAHWRQVLKHDDPSLFERVIMYEKYCLVLKEAQDGCFRKFTQLWRLDGQVDHLPISDSIKSILRWFYQNVSEDGIVSRPLYKSDPDLDFFATSMVKNMAIYSELAKVVQPKVPLITEGMLSCYDYMPGKLNFHIVIHGRYDLGKTYQLLTTLQNFTSIPGTCSKESRATAAADDCGQHIYDVKVLRDEIPAWMVSKVEQDKNPELANRKKEILTAKNVALKSFEFIQAPNGDRQRTFIMYTTDHYMSEACVTNQIVEKTEALMSRYFTMVMKDVGLSVNDKQFKVDSFIKKQGQLRLQWNEYHSAAGKKAAMCGAIVPDVDFTLMRDVSSQMIEWLEQAGAIPKDSGYRPQEIIEPFLRQMIYHRAILLTWDIPSAPHYNKRYNLRQIQDMQPHLSPTLQQILFCWTLLCSQYVNSDKSIVISAILKALSLNWTEGTTAYDMFVNQKKAQLPFRRRYNTAHKPVEGADDDDRYLIDLNYVTIEGSSLEKCCETISEYMPVNNRICATDVVGIIRVLADTTVQPPRNGYKLLPAGTAQKHHCKRPTDRDGVLEWTKVRVQMPGEEPREMTEEDWPPMRPLNEKYVMHVAEIEKVGHKGKVKVHVAPWALFKFKEEIILTAFHNVTMNPNFPRQKMITGWTRPEDPAVFQTRDYTEPTLAREWSQTLATSERRLDGFTRMDGIVFKRCDYLSETTAQTLFDEPLVHIGARKLEEQMARYKAEQLRRSKPLELVTDLEYWGFLKQHVRCGRPLDEPVQTPAQVKKQYEEACAMMNKRKDKAHSYPRDNIIKSVKKKHIYERAVRFNINHNDVNLQRFEQSSSCDSFVFNLEEFDVNDVLTRDKRDRRDLSASDKGKEEEVEMYDRPAKIVRLADLDTMLQGGLYNEDTNF